MKTITFSTSRHIRHALRLAEYVVVGCIIALGVLFAASVTPLAGYRVYAVVSGSMEPTLPLGSLAVVAPAASYATGDVVTAASGDPRHPVTHRIVRMDGSRVVTKGDANATDDPMTRTTDQIIGRVRWHIPVLGRVLAFAQTVPGFIFLVVIPATLLVYHETLALVTAIEQQIRRRSSTT